MWGVTWLLGGDVSIVPVRYAAGPTDGIINIGTVNPPPEGAVFWTGSYLKANKTGLSYGHKLVSRQTGQLIPYDSAGTSSNTKPGWYFTKDGTYATRSANATQFVRVEGPASLVNTQLKHCSYYNLIPTDLYYSSLTSYVNAPPASIDSTLFVVPSVYVPPHDLDAIDNGIYGQVRRDNTDLDGVIFRTDLSVGRAPVENAAEA